MNWNSGSASVDGYDGYGVEAALVGVLGEVGGVDAVVGRHVGVGVAVVGQFDS